MSGSIRRSEVNDHTKVNVFFYLNDELFDPATLVYTIYKPEGIIVTGQEEKTPLKHDVGWYYADWTVLGDAELGRYKVQWIFQKNVGDLLCSKADFIDVIADRPENCVARHIPSNSGEGGGDPNVGSEDCGTCDCQCNQYIRDHWGRIINL